MRQSLLLLFLLIVGMTPTKADNITVDGTSRSYNVIVPNNLGEGRPLRCSSSATATIRMPAGCRTASSKTIT